MHLFNKVCCVNVAGIIPQGLTQRNTLFAWLVNVADPIGCKCTEGHSATFSERFCLTRAWFSQRSSPHGAQVPAPYGCVVSGGQLSAVVMWAPLPRGELELTFAL